MGLMFLVYTPYATRLTPYAKVIGNENDFLLIIAIMKDAMIDDTLRMQKVRY